MSFEDSAQGVFHGSKVLVEVRAKVLLCHPWNIIFVVMFYDISSIQPFVTEFIYALPGDKQSIKLTL